MPIFIAPDPTHVVIRSEIPALYDQRGNMVAPKQRRLFAKFKRGAAPGYGRDIAAAEMPMPAMPDGVTLGQWLAAYDSGAGQAENGWTEEEHDLIVETLKERGYRLIERPRIASPYPMYDKHRTTRGQRTIEHAVKDIVAAHEQAGFDVDQAVLYEQENGNDPQVLAALASLAVPEAEEADALISA